MSDHPPIAEPDPDDPYYQAPRLTILLTHYRSLAKLSQSDVHYWYGIDQSALSDWESGKHRPTDASLRRLALAYGDRIATMNADRIYAHLVEARDQTPQAHTYDDDVSILADHIQAYPRRERARIVRLVAGILEHIDRWMKSADYGT